jgi:septum formation protein
MLAPELILASTSRYRAELLRRLGLPFTQEAPGSDETPYVGEAPAALAQRLALAKAQAVAARHPQTWVIGSDQVCACGDELLGKPGSRERAIEQLRLLSGNSAQFHTALALAHGASGRVLSGTDLTTVRFRRLDKAQIERYVAAEPSFDCAGSFKSEGLGIALCAAIESQDPTALVGLPLVALCGLLREAGFALP